MSDTPEPADCQICGRPAELISEENYFFRLSAYQDKLLQLYKDNPQFVQPDFRLNEVKSFVESGLKDLSISRKSIKWGIPWPGDPEHVFYVWYDALTSYMSGIGFVDGESKDSAKFKKYWMSADSQVVHMIGKEIIRFHAVYWPAFLMAAGLPLPKQIFAHGWLLFEQEKMSKSKGNVAYPEPIVRVLGNDALRYYLLARNRLRPGRQFFPRSSDYPLQRRSRERPRQSREPHSRDDSANTATAKVPEPSPKFDEASSGTWYGVEAIEISQEIS